MSMEPQCPHATCHRAAWVEDTTEGTIVCESCGRQYAYRAVGLQYETTPIHRVLDKDALLALLPEIQKIDDPDCPAWHAIAALLDYINDPEIEAAVAPIVRWC